MMKSQIVQSDTRDQGVWSSSINVRSMYSLTNSPDVVSLVLDKVAMISRSPVPSEGSVR